MHLTVRTVRNRPLTALWVADADATTGLHQAPRGPSWSPPADDADDADGRLHTPWAAQAGWLFMLNVRSGILNA